MKLQTLISASQRDGSWGTGPSQAPAPARVQRIFVADDDNSIRLIISTALARAGYEVSEASDGEQAWEAISHGHYDLLITDNEMPCLTGIKLIERIRDAGMSLPVIMATGSFSMEGMRDYAELQLATVILKPFETSEFLTIVRIALQVSGKEAAADQGSYAGSPVPRSPAQATAAQPLHNRVLIADDDSCVRGSLAAVLASEGYIVIPAENGQQALDLVNASSVDLVLLDLNMPVKNGWDTLEHLTREHPLIPIIIATARPNQLFTALNAGVGALLEKPMDIPVLLRTMEKLLVESTEQRLARLAGKKTEFHYHSATTSSEC
jgi:DNA-binding NtrC family response regulator